MLFNSYIFLLLFLPICIFIYFLLHKHGRHTMALTALLIMSLWFYGYFNYKYLLILCGSIIANWFISRLMLRVKDIYQKPILIFGILGNILLIFIFKYYDFFITNINTVFKTSFELQHILLPLGISFFTFQQISYLVDSYRKETQGYRFIEYAAFVSFFPQLVAGPIVLHNELIPQFKTDTKWKFNHENFANGIYVLAAGLFKKIMIADIFGLAVSWAWGGEVIDSLTSLEIIIVTLCYTFQIYFDFSAYSDMAIGIGKLFNIELPINFNSPYKATSIVDFWNRWHLTLTRFLREYIYFPLGGSKKGSIRTYINIMIIFIISGIWHGAYWTFFLWGFLHGIANVLNRIFSKSWNKCNQVFQWFCTFTFVNITWLIFRADSISQALILIKRALLLNDFSISSDLYNCFSLVEFNFLFEHIKLLNYLPSRITGFCMWTFLAIAFFICINTSNIHEKKFKPTLAKSAATIIMLVWSIVSFAGISTFLYFNF